MKHLKAKIAFTAMLTAVLFTVGASAAMINITTSAPANATNVYPRYCGYTGTAFTFTAYSSSDADFDCHVYFDSVTTALAVNATTHNASMPTTITGTVPTTSAGQKNWYVSCTDSATTVNSTTLVAPVYQSSVYCNMNTSEGIGTSVINGIKGSAQLTTGVVDAAFNPAMGVLEVGAVSILLLLLGFGVASSGKSVGQLRKAI